MDLYLMELLIKERQQQILDEFKRIKISRAVNNHKVGIFKKFILGLREVLIAMGIYLQKRYRSSIKPALSGLGKGIRSGQKAQKYIAKAKQQRTGHSDNRNIQKRGTAVCCGTGNCQR